MKVCLIGDLSDAAMLKIFASIFGYRKDEVLYAKKDTHKRAEEHAWEVFSNIAESDTVIILPGDDCNITTVYEMTYARKLGKQVMAFNKADDLVDITNFIDEDYDNLFPTGRRSRGSYSNRDQVSYSSYYGSRRDSDDRRYSSNKKVY